MNAVESFEDIYKQVKSFTNEMIMWQFENSNTLVEIKFMKIYLVNDLKLISK